MLQPVYFRLFVERVVTLTYDDFRTALKTKDLTPLYLFSGEEDFLSAFCLTEAKKALIDPSFEDFNYKCYIEAPVFEDADTFINALPLMSEKKLVIFNNCGIFSNGLTQKNKWEKLFTSLPSYVVCIIREEISEKGKKGSVVEQAVKGMGSLVTFDYLPEARLRPWLVKAAASRGKSLSDRDALYIIQNLGRSMTLLRSEIEKIAAKAEDFVISRSDIDAVIRNVLDESVFTLTDSIIYKRRDLAFNTLSNLELSGTEPVSVISVFATQILGIYKAKLMMTQKMSLAEVKKAISYNPYVADKMVQKASKTTLSDLEQLISMITDAEYKIKTGLIDARSALDLIIAN